MVARITVSFNGKGGLHDAKANYLTYPNKR